jgi:hypothetical protein
MSHYDPRGCQVLLALLACAAIGAIAIILDWLT